MAALGWLLNLGFGGSEAAAPAFQAAWAQFDEVFGAMRKNTAGQVIGVQMVSATDGSAFTGSVSVAVTGDGGTQGAGGGAAPVHEGNGYHTYSPTQAETNYDLIGFTFTGTGAVPKTVQVFTTANLLTDVNTECDTAISDAALATAAALATVDANVDLIVADTNELQTDWADGGRLDLIIDAILVDTGTTLDGKIDAVDTVVDAIKAKTDSLTFTVANQVDSNVQSINDVTITGDGSVTPFNV